MAEEQKQNQEPQVVDMPEGKMEISVRVLSNELIGVKMSVDDMKMKWVVIGVAAVGVLLWAASAFAPELTSMFDTLGG